MVNLNDHFAEVMSRLPTRSSMRADAFAFTSKNLRPCLAKLTDVGMIGIARQRYANMGLVDNLVLVLDRRTSTAIGLWLMSVALHGAEGPFILELQHPKSDIKRLLLNPNLSEGTEGHLSIEKFVWNPQDLDRFLETLEGAVFLSQRPNCVFLAIDHDVRRPELYAVRDTFAIRGPQGGVCLLSVFFLNFGLESCTNNYEYINYQFGRRITDLDSCELRLELTGASISI